MMLPILYTVLTTICAFLSLVFSGIKPIIDFGWMMTLGLIVSLTSNFFIITYFIKLILLKNEIMVQEYRKIIYNIFISFFSQKIMKF